MSDICRAMPLHFYLSYLIVFHLITFLVRNNFQKPPKGQFFALDFEPVIFDMDLNMIDQSSQVRSKTILMSLVEFR